MPRWYTVAIALCLVLMLAIVANAQGKSDKCLSPTLFVQQVRAAAPELQVVHFVGSHAEKMIAAYSELPPKNIILADEMMVVFMPQTQQARSVFFAGGCAIGAGVIRLDMMRKLIREALGDDA